MGLFSFKTNDTRKSITHRYSSKKTFPVFMLDNKGNVWKEENYNGYGVFGGKDFYQLLAEMNNCSGLTGKVENDRAIGIALYFSEDNKFISPNLVEKRIVWKNQVPKWDLNQGY